MTSQRKIGAQRTKIYWTHCNPRHNHIKIDQHVQKILNVAIVSHNDTRRHFPFLQSSTAIPTIIRRREYTPGTYNGTLSLYERYAGYLDMDILSVSHPDAWNKIQRETHPPIDQFQ
jgi:hypothetical protein